jgi:hypothetical protein
MTNDEQPSYKENISQPAQSASAEVGATNTNKLKLPRFLWLAMIPALLLVVFALLEPKSGWVWPGDRPIPGIGYRLTNRPIPANLEAALAWKPKDETAAMFMEMAKKEYFENVEGAKLMLDPTTLPEWNTKHPHADLEAKVELAKAAVALMSSVDLAAKFENRIYPITKNSPAPAGAVIVKVDSE